MERKQGRILMHSDHGYSSSCRNNVTHSQNGGVGSNSNVLLVIKLPHTRVLRVMSRCTFFAFVILSLPWIGTILRGSSTSHFSAVECSSGYKLITLEVLDCLLQDFRSEGLIKSGDKALIVSPLIDAVLGSSQVVNGNEVELMSKFNLERQGSLLDEEFNLVFAAGPVGTEFVNRVLKRGGILAVQSSIYLPDADEELSNYRIIHLQQCNFTIVTAKKTGAISKFVYCPSKQQPWLMRSEAKKASLKGLEHALLEPPRKALPKSHEYLKKLRFLPDLLGDSLESYPRRIFVSVGSSGENSDTVQWFHQNYPTRNQEFEVYNLEIMPEEESSRVVHEFDVSNWFVKNVKEEEYVVMKAEADVVEEMIKNGTICLVDELFLWCNSQWEDWGERDNKRESNQRAYWECLALYGRLRDEGVAVHQWWG